MKKKIWIHVAMIAAMFAVACIYLSPILSGKALVQGDQQKAQAMAYQLHREKDRTGHFPSWEGAMFSGMPAYQIREEPPTSPFYLLREVVIMAHVGWANNIGIIFLYLLGFYVSMILLGLSPWLALIGALGFGLGSYNIIIIEAGHSTKAWAIAMMAPILAGMVAVLKAAVTEGLERKVRNHRVIWGSILFTVALILQVTFNHIQITFYTAIGCVAIGAAYLVQAIVNKRLLPFGAKAGILAICALLALGCNIRHLMVNEEYSRYTMRGGSELTVTPEDLYGDGATQAQETTTGLDINYAFAWSYGKGETYTLLVPGAMGGGSGEKVSHESSFYRTFHAEQAPLYWGEQPFTSGPVYFGAVVLLLCLIGLIVVKEPERWWVLTATVIGILLSWGSNLMGLNEWVFNNIPFYNKFRTPSMSLVLPNVCVAIMAVLALKAIFDKERDRKRVNLGIYIGAGALCALILVVLVASGSFSYTGSSDRQMAAQYGAQWDTIFGVLVSDRAALLRSDSWRSIIFILLAAAVLWLYNNDKIKKAGIAIALVGVLVLIDLWGVDRRYLSKDNFVEKRQLELKRDKWDYDIDEMAAAYGDHDYRVFNLAVNTFNDSKPAAFHDQVGGYSAAKLSRYQNLIDFYLSRHINPNILNMLNTRYIVLNDGRVQRNPAALGNVWFVREVKAVNGADEEIMALNGIDPSLTAVVDTSKWSVAGGQWSVDSSATIVLKEKGTKSMDYRRYVSSSATEQLAVFSEIHYEPDWVAYIDGKRADYLRANYVLRAMVVPAGQHEIEFKNEAPTLHKTDTYGLIIAIITLMAMVAAGIYSCKGERKVKGER